MKEIEIQQRVLQNGKLLDLDKFKWCDKTNTFSSDEDNLVLDFGSLDRIKIIITGYSSTIKAGYYSTIKAGYYSTIKAGSYSTIKAGDYSTIITGYSSTIKAGYYSTIDAGYSSTIDAGDYQIVIVNRNVFEVIQPRKGGIIQICPYNIGGHLVNGMLDGVPHIIVDGILSRVISQKGNIYKVVNHGETELSYIIKDGDNYSHGKTLKDARESVMYKLSNRDTTKYKDMNLDTVLTKAECIQMYRAITGACEEGTKYFVNNQKKVKAKYKISEIIEATKGQYGNEKLTEFFK